MTYRPRGHCKTKPVAKTEPPNIVPARPSDSHLVVWHLLSSFRKRNVTWLHGMARMCTQRGGHSGRSRGSIEVDSRRPPPPPRRVRIGEGRRCEGPAKWGQIGPEPNFASAPRCACARLRPASHGIGGGTEPTDALFSVRNHHPPASTTSYRSLGGGSSRRFQMGGPHGPRSSACASPTRASPAGQVP